MSEDLPTSRKTVSRRAQPSRWTPPKDWRAHLTGRSADALLDRIADGDPLGIRTLVGERIRAAAVLVDVDRVQLRALAAVAFECAASGPPDRKTKLVALVDRSIVEIVEEASLARADEEDSVPSLFATFAEPLELDASALWRACDAFNACDLEERRAFFELVVERATLEGAARVLGEDPLRVAHRGRRALEVALRATCAPEISSEPIAPRHGIRR